jgi:murein tripeptide amidase MpaA
MNHAKYYSNQDLEEQLTNWAADFPHLCRLSQLGTSQDGRPIWLLTLTNQDRGSDTSKPALWIDGNLHATEISGTTMALTVAAHLLENHGKDETATRLLDRAAFYIAPRLNPDGAYLAMGENPRFIRSGTRPYPWLEKEEGLHQQDVDGDGLVLQMRIPDPSGSWKISSLDPRLMEKRRPDESGGRYYRLLPEGMLEDYDGSIIKVARPQQRLDFNRNYPFEWRPENEQTGAGPYPASEPEVRAQVAFFAEHPNISFAISYHTFSGVILRPYSTRPDEDMETSDVWVYEALGEIAKEHTGYRCVSTFHDFKYHPKEVTTGAFDDWAYDQLGVFSFTIELWDLPTRAGIKDRKLIEWFRKHPHEDDLKILEWIDANGGEQAYVEWRPFDHPQLGEIEIGGWNSMYTWRNPPPAFLHEEMERNLPFVLSLGQLLPELSVHTLKATHLSGDTYQVNLVVENSGFLPTFTSEKGKNRSVRPVRAELELPEEIRLKSGKRRVELGHLPGRSADMEVTSFFSSSGTENRARAEWVLEGPAGAAFSIKIHSERAGSIEKTVRLDKGEIKA